MKAVPDDIQTISAELAMRELARRSYGEYLAYVNGRTWKRTRFASYLAREVQGFIEADTGNAYDILVIEAPPQHGKSMQITEALPSWCLGRHPDWRVILASYNDDTAERFARRNKEKVAGYGEALFGITIGDVNRATEFELAASGGAIPGRLISRGILAGITGNPANLLLIDDPIKNRQEADSPTKRQQIWNEWLNSLKSRLAAGAKVVVIMTPWHEDDLAARLLATERNIRLIRLPVEAELDDPLGREPASRCARSWARGRRGSRSSRTAICMTRRADPARGQPCTSAPPVWRADIWSGGSGGNTTTRRRSRCSARRLSRWTRRSRVTKTTTLWRLRSGASWGTTTTSGTV